MERHHSEPNDEEATKNDTCGTGTGSGRSNGVVTTHVTLSRKNVGHRSEGDHAQQKSDGGRCSVLAEMRRGDSFRGWQMQVTDKGKSYEIAFIEDPLHMTMCVGPGMSWLVRKPGLHLSGATFYH